jgi:hypothetical protein
MRVPTIKDLMREQAKFTHYEGGNLWYQILYTEGGAYSGGGNTHLFDFPVDITLSDAAGKFESNMKAVNLMRWIRRHIDYLNKIIDEEKAEAEAGGEW